MVENHRDMTDGFKDIEKLEADLWEAADNLRANSKLTSGDYFMPVLGVIFLRQRCEPVRYGYTSDRGGSGGRPDAQAQGATRRLPAPTSALAP